MKKLFLLITALVLASLPCFGQQTNYPSGGAPFAGAPPVGPSYQDITEIAAPANPAAGVERVYSDSTAHVLKCLTSGGGSCLLGGNVSTGQTNVYGAFLQDFSLATMKLPQGAGFVTTANSTVGLDTTANNFHFWSNGADSINGVFAAAPVTGDVVSATVSAGNVLLSDTGILATNLVRLDTSNVGAAGMSLNMTNSTGATAFRIPVKAGCTSGLSGTVCFDSTAGNTHIWTNGADSLAVAEAAALAANNIPKQVDATHGILGAGSMTDSGNTVTSTSYFRGLNPCRITADVTLSTSATNICSFTLGAVALPWYLQCNFMWAVTAGTTPTLSFGVNASQTPTGATNVDGTILTTNADVGTEASAALSASGALNVITSGTLTPAATIFTGNMFGTLLASATPGSFAITATGVGASFAGVVKAGSGCTLQ